MNEMIERVAERMVDFTMAVDWDDPNRENVFRSLARVAMEAMREPTEAMVAAVDLTNFEREDRMHCDEAYTAMIDAAMA